jgi:hypothetical protein
MVRIWQESFMRKMIITLVLASAGAGQTTVDLRTQSKGMDFRNAIATMPFKTNAALPANCDTGEMFFRTGALAGQNVFGCAAPNTWVLQGLNGLKILNRSTEVGTEPTLDFSAGLGITSAISDTGDRITVEHSVDTAVIQTRADQQSGRTLLCSSASGSASAYTCELTPTITSYTQGMLLRWLPDLNGAGGATTLNVDTLGAAAIKLADGIADPSPADIVAGRLHEIWYDGARFRLLGAKVPPGGLGELRPVCGASTRGRTWFTPGGSGSSDTFAVCLKDAADTYAWRGL